MKRTLTLLLWLAVVAVGCMTPRQLREDEFLTEARAWNDDFRWGRWDIVGQSMAPEENARFQERRHLVDADLVIVDYEVTSVRFLQNSDAAAVDVMIEWYKKSDPSIRHTNLQQRWENRTGHWMMIKERRVRGDRFPLVPEPAGEKGSPPPAGEPGTESRPASP